MANQNDLNITDSETRESNMRVERLNEQIAEIADQKTELNKRTALRRLLITAEEAKLAILSRGISDHNEM